MVLDKDVNTFPQNGSCYRNKNQKRTTACLATDEKDSSSSSSEEMDVKNGNMCHLDEEKLTDNKSSDLCINGESSKLTSELDIGEMNNTAKHINNTAKHAKLQSNATKIHKPDGMSGKAVRNRGNQCSLSSGESLLMNKTKYESTSSNYKTTDKMSCDEVQSLTISSFTMMFDLDTLLNRLKKLVMAYLTSAIPDWLSEPEFMIFPKPHVDKTVVHSHADSLFSTSSGFTNYYGILNLCLILLVLGNARLFLENFIKYGILINYSYITDWLFNEPYNWPNLLLTVSINIYPAIALLTEKLLVRPLSKANALRAKAKEKLNKLKTLDEQLTKKTLKKTFELIDFYSVN